MTYDKDFEEWELRHIGVSTSIDFDAMYAAWQAARKDHYRIGEEVEAKQIGAQWKKGTVVAGVYSNNNYYIEKPELVRRIPPKSRISRRCSRLNNMGNKQMITDKDREELIEDLRAYNDAWVLEEGKDRDRLIEFESAIRAESADHARKEAAERVRKVMNVSEGGSDTIDKICAAILGDSFIKENLTTDHIPDIGKKLAIAVKALIALYGWIKAEVENFGATCPDDFIIDMVEIALKEIQG